MAFQNKNLSVIAYANGWTYWVYRDFESAIQDLGEQDYFKPVKDLMNCGDLITLCAKDTTATYYIKSITPLVLRQQGA